MTLSNLLKFFRTKTDLAAAVGVTKQTVSKRQLDNSVPDAWLYRLQKTRPDIFINPEISGVRNE